MPRTARQSTVQLLGALMALGVIVLLVWTTTTAAFVDTTDNTGNLFGAGFVELTDDDAGVALFNVDAMSPGQIEVGCIEVSYEGSVITDLGAVSVYADIELASAAGTLEGDLNVTVEEGTGATPTGMSTSGVAM